jgi:hypothetical protein
LFTVGLVGQPADLPPFAKQHTATLTFYYKSPNPDLGPRLLKDFLRRENVEHPWWNGKDHVVMINGALFGDIAAGRPKVIREYETVFAEAAPLGRRVIIRALMNCGDADTSKRIDAWLADPKTATPKAELEALKKHLADPNRKPVRDRQAKTPDDLDLHWANFFITGEYAPIARILDVLDQPDAKDIMVVKRVAKWSLESNLQQHPRLVELVKEHVKERPAGSKKVIEDCLNPVP